MTLSTNTNSIFRAGPCSSSIFFEEQPNRIKTETKQLRKLTICDFMNFIFYQNIE